MMPEERSEAGTLMAPHFMDGERQVLANLVFSNGQCDKPMVMASLDDDCFFGQERREVWQAVSRLWSRQEQIDPSTVSYELQRLGHNNGQAYLTQAVGNCQVMPNSVEYNLGRLQECRRRRQLMKTLGEGMSMLSDLDSDVDEVAMHVHHAVVHGHDAATKPEDRLKSTLHAIISDYGQERQEASMTGFPSIDCSLGGLLPGELFLIVGRPGAGKTWLWLNMLAHMLREGNTCMIASGEIGCKELLCKLVCKLGGVNYKKYRTGKLTEADLSKFTSACAELSEYNLLPISKSEASSLSHLHAIAQHYRPKVVAVDGVYLYTPKRKTEGWEYWQDISRELKSISTEAECLVMATTQLGRSQKVAFSDAFRQDASLLLVIDGEQLSCKTKCRATKARDTGFFQFQLWVDFETSQVAEQVSEGTPTTPFKNLQPADPTEVPF